MKNQKQMRLDLFENFIDKEKDVFISTTKGLKKSFNLLRRNSIPKRISVENVKTTPNSSINLLTKIKNEGDILGLLPSTKVLIKHFDGLDSLAEHSDFDLNDDEKSNFLQRFYKFFIKFPKNGISKENKIILLSDSETIKEIYYLDKSVESLSDNDFKAIVQIYKMKIENKNDGALKLAKQYKKSPLFRRNITNIIMIHNLAFDNGFDFNFVNKHIVDLLLISYLNKNNISKAVVTKNILFTLQNLKDEKTTDLESIFNNTKTSKGELISRINKDINLQSWLLMKITIGNAKTNKLSFVKEVFNLNISAYQMRQVLALSNGSVKNREDLSKLVLNLNSEKDNLFLKINSALSSYPPNEPT